jgi:hypothetical protein
MDKMRRTNIIYDQQSFRFQLRDCHRYGLHCNNIVKQIGHSGKQIEIHQVWIRIYTLKLDFV